MKYFIFLFFAIFLGYGGDWAPYYVNLFVGGDAVKNLGPISRYSKDCIASPRGNAVCSAEYQIPFAIL